MSYHNTPSYSPSFWRSNKPCKNQSFHFIELHKKVLMTDVIKTWLLCFVKPPKSNWIKHTRKSLALKNTIKFIWKPMFKVNEIESIISKSNSIFLNIPSINYIMGTMIIVETKIPTVSILLIIYCLHWYLSIYQVKQTTDYYHHIKHDPYSTIKYLSTKMNPSVHILLKVCELYY